MAASDAAAPMQHQCEPQREFVQVFPLILTMKKPYGGIYFSNLEMLLRLLLWYPFLLFKLTWKPKYFISLVFRVRYFSEVDWKLLKWTRVEKDSCRYCPLGIVCTQIWTLVKFAARMCEWAIKCELKEFFSFHHQPFVIIQKCYIPSDC